MSKTPIEEQIRELKERCRDLEKRVGKNANDIQKLDYWLDEFADIMDLHKEDLFVRLSAVERHLFPDILTDLKKLRKFLKPNSKTEPYGLDRRKKK